MSWSSLRTLIVAAIVGLLGAVLSTSAPALFTAVDEEQETAEQTASTDDASGQTVAPVEGTSGAPRAPRAIDPFGNPSGVEMPEDVPVAATGRSLAWYNRPKNARHFEHLLARTTPPAAAPAVTTKRDEPAPSVKADDGHVLDYVVGILVVAALATTILLLFRRAH
jgi:hypothetical protein